MKTVIYIVGYLLFPALLYAQSPAPAAPAVNPFLSLNPSEDALKPEATGSPEHAQRAERPEQRKRPEQAERIEKTAKPAAAESIGHLEKSSLEDNGDDDPVKSKVFSSSFALDGNDKVQVSNQFGSITVKTWDKNEVKYDADIKAYALTDAAAQELLNAVSIETSKNGDLASFKTIIQQKRGLNNFGRGTKNGVKWRREIKINIIIYLPANRALTASQSYGNITMDDFSGPTALKVQYGNLIAGNLNHTNNNINIQYGKAELKNVNQANIKHQYGEGLSLLSANNLELDAQYASATIGTIRHHAQIKQQYGKGLNLTSVNDLDLESQYAPAIIGTIRHQAQIKQQYGKGLTIANAGSLSLTAQYTPVKIDRLGGTLTGSLQYGKLNVAGIDDATKILNIVATYTDVDLAFAQNYNGTFQLTTQYGGFSYGSRIHAKSDGDASRSRTSKSYSGQIGNGGAAQVNVNAQYGSVRMN